MPKQLLPHGLDDLSWCVEQLLTNCFTEAERRNVAERIVSEITGIADDLYAVKNFKKSVRLFARHGESQEHVLWAYIAFLEQVGPVVDMRNRVTTSGSKGGKASAKRARDESFKEIEVAMGKLTKKKPHIKERP